MSSPTGSTGPTGSAEGGGDEGSEVVLVRTGTTDPVAVLGAVSWVPDDGPLLAVLATVPRERLERRLADAGWDSDGSLVVDSVPAPGGTVRDGSERGYGDVAGLSMELVGRLDALAEAGGLVYLDSLEPFVDLAGFESTFRFLVIVTARARTAGVPVVARLDPDAVDPVTAGTLSEAFDRVVEGPPDAPSGAD